MENILKTLEKNAKEREENERNQMRKELAEKLEPYILGYLTRRRLKGTMRLLTMNCFNDFTDLDKSNKELLTIEQVLKKAPRVLENAKKQGDVEMICNICRHLIMSLDSQSKDVNFAAAFLNKNTISEARGIVSTIFGEIPGILSRVKGEKAAEQRQWQCLIHFIIVFSTCSTWSLVRNATPQVHSILNGMCGKWTAIFYENDGEFEKLAAALFMAVNSFRPLINLETVNAHFSIVFKPIRSDNCPVDIFYTFCTKVMMSPAILVHLNQQNLEIIKSSNLFSRLLNWMKKNQEEIEGTLDVRLVLNLLANLVHFAYLDEQALETNLYDWTWAIGITLTRCTEMAVKNSGRSSTHYWHPVFGHYLVPIDKRTEGALKHVLVQFRMLWSAKIVRKIFDYSMEKSRKISQNDGNSGVNKSPAHHKEITAAFGKLWKKLGGSADGSKDRSSDFEPPPTLVAIVCQVYMTALSTMTHLKSEIISGICRDDKLLRQLWDYLKEWGEKYPNWNGSSMAATIFHTGSNADHWGPVSASLQSLKRPTSPHTATLRLFLEAAAAIISILDEEEIFEKGTPFSTNELEIIAKYTNIFCYRSIWNGGIDELAANTPGLFQSVHSLLQVLYERDSRRQFVQDSKFWQLSEVKSSSIMMEYEKKLPRGLLAIKKMAHLVPIKERMLLFRRHVNEDKQHVTNASRSTVPQTWITIQRNRIIEDGFKQLSKLSVDSLKSTIRVRFVNEQGLDEAGIDQDGVFKEFLEETLKKVFDPQLSLFAVTSTGLMYPSPTSGLHEDHLSLFQFVGKMLGKAMYEGIVIDVRLAPVLLAAVLGNHKLCAFDELSQLDPELYRSLTFVKRYEGDVSDLSLTFSIDEDFMDKIRTIDLVACGRTVPVTNDNKIDYVHRMAHHRVFERTREQCKAFVQGIQSILQLNWLNMFSPNDLQCLISGQNSDIDLADLKRHVQYFGGFHTGHRLIKWLWDILENKFDAKERKLFLKFVTSCSRPPVLGFSFLEPPFSIRCVEVADDQDQGDTLGSVVRGFLTLRRGTAASRLPTASTCFNLLKLPNYNKKSLLLEKLRYAIHAETGFELS